MTDVQDAIDISGGPGKGEWNGRAEMALRMLDIEMDEYRKSVDGGDGESADVHLALAAHWAAIYTAATFAAGG